LPHRSPWPGLPSSLPSFPSRPFAEWPQQGPQWLLWCRLHGRRFLRLLPSRPRRAAIQASPFSRVTRSGNSRAASSAEAPIGRIGSPTTQDYSIRSPSRRARSWSSRDPCPPQLAPLSERFWFIQVIRSGRSPSPTTAKAPNGNVLPAPIPLSAIPARSTPARLSSCPHVVAPKPPDSSASLLRARHTVPSSAGPPTICPFGRVANP